jgi:hypothetical protein
MPRYRYEKYNIDILLCYEATQIKRGRVVVSTISFATLKKPFNIIAEGPSLTTTDNT